MTVDRKMLREKCDNALLIGVDAIEIARACVSLLDKLEEVEGDLEAAHMRLIACQCVADANTMEGAKNIRDILEAWRSPAFVAVCGAVDREMDLRESLQETAEALAVALSRLGVCGEGGEGGDQERRADSDSWGGTAALFRARKAIAEVP